jgi:xylulokinase
MPVIGLDIGTQSLKALAVDSGMTVLGEGSVPYMPSFPRPGWAEQDPRLWLAALRPAIGQALAASRLQAADIEAIGVTGQLDGCVPVDANGQALGPCIIWMDRRAVAECGAVPADLVRDRAGLVRDATHLAAKVAWTRRHVAEAARTARWHQPVSLVVEALCGRAVMDHALASTTMLYGLEARDYDEDLLAAFSIDRGSLPAIDEGSALAGTLHAAGAELSGLRPGTPVAVGTGDDFANAIGSGVAEPGVVCCGLGTGEAMGAVADRLVIDPDGLVETHGYIDGRFFISNPGWLAGGSVSWFLETFGVEGPATLAAEAATIPPGSDGLLFLPALCGAMAPRWVPGARGAFYGLTPAHRRAACGRALLEGCAYAMNDVVGRLDALGVRTDRIRLAGGGARSRLWAQIRADVANRPVEYGPAGDAAPLGAAALAMFAAGLAGSVREAVAPLAAGRKVCQPDPGARPAYEHAYARYRKLFEALTPMFDDELAAMALGSA